MLVRNNRSLEETMFQRLIDGDSFLIVYLEHLIYIECARQKLAASVIQPF
jgi:hypothetical protein